MLTFSKMSAGQEDYYLNLAREDYYTKGGEPPGLWCGRGAGKLGLSGEVSAEELRHLFRGFSPDGERKLRRNAGSKSRLILKTTRDGIPIVDREGKQKTKIYTAQSGWDLTFSAPKSVSVLWAVSPDLRYQIQEAQERATLAALDYLESREAKCRRGKGGVEQGAVDLVVATYEHGTSRAQDPQLHTHALVLNVGVREDETTGAIESKPFYKAQLAADAVYQAELARILEAELLLEIRKTEHGFELACVPESLCKELSKRRAAIEADLAASGESGVASAARAALRTRSTKSHIARRDLFEQWTSVAESYGFFPERIMRKEPKYDVRQSLKESIRNADETLTYHESHFVERDVIRCMAQQSIGKGFGWSEIKELGLGYLDSESVKNLGRHYDEQLYTTKDLYDCESAIVHWVTQGMTCTDYIVSEYTLADVLTTHPVNLNDEQLLALCHITQHHGDVSVMSGMAGTGKTTILDAARKAWEQEGYSVQGLCLAGRAADGLERESGIKSDTIARFFLDIESGQKKLHSKTIFVVDESVMVGTRQMAQLLLLAADNEAKLVLVGDPKQLQSIEAGGAYRAIADLVGEVTLTKIMRQREPWAREAVKAFAENRTKDALEAYLERGHLKVSESRMDAALDLIADWKKQGGLDTPKHHLILAMTREETGALNLLAQEARHHCGRLSKEGIEYQGDWFYEGDRVVFTRSYRGLRVRNGNFGTISRIDKERHIVEVLLDGQEERVVPYDLKRYKGLSLGYAATTYKAQGLTVDNSYVMSGGYMQTREQAYVQASRHRNTCRMYVDRECAGDDLSRLAHSLSRSRVKEFSHCHEQSLCY